MAKNRLSWRRRVVASKGAPEMERGKLSLVLGFLCTSCACDYFPECADLRLAPDVMHVDALAFAISYRDNPTPVKCQEIQIISDTSEDTSFRTDWSLQASKAVACPNPLKWGQEVVEGFEVLVAPLPLERNRRYQLTLLTDDGKRTRNEWLDFCVFQDGSLAVEHYYRCFAYAPESEKVEREHLQRCMEEKALGGTTP